jgi:hypothetical protein
LREFGIAPPPGTRSAARTTAADPATRAMPIDVAGISPLRRASVDIACPRCASTRTQLVSQFARPRARRITAASIASSRSTIQAALNVSKFHRLQVAKVERETRDAVAITFAVPEALAEAFRFIAGQHLTLKADIEGQDVRRSYSICSGAHDGSCASPSNAIPAACSPSGRIDRSKRDTCSMSARRWGTSTFRSPSTNAATTSVSQPAAASRRSSP